MTGQGGQNEFRLRLECALGIPFTSGNQIEILRNGDEIFPAMLDAIRAAEHTIEFVSFVYWTGRIADEFARALADRARQGLTVNVLLDGVGAMQMSDELVKLMKDAGVQVEWFRPPVRWKVWKTDHRTHRKVLVCDGRVGFTGGVGIAKEWEGDARNPDEWRETHFRLEGPVVHGIRAAFLGNWAETGRPAHQLIERTHLIEPAGEVAIQTVRTTASVGWSDAAMLMRSLLVMARRTLRLTTAYFVPDQTSLDLLSQAARRGVDVQVLVPGPHMDVRLCRLAGEAVYRPLLEAGVKIWEYQKTMLHTKVITVDGQLACIGSANFNQRSMRKDDELILSILHEPTAAALDRDFDEDIEFGKPILQGRWKNRGPVQRVKEWFAHLVKPEL